MPCIINKWGHENGRRESIQHRRHLWGWNQEGFQLMAGAWGRRPNIRRGGGTVRAVKTTSGLSWNYKNMMSKEIMWADLHLIIDVCIMKHVHSLQQNRGRAWMPLFHEAHILYHPTKKSLAFTELNINIYKNISVVWVASFKWEYISGMGIHPSRQKAARWRRLWRQEELPHQKNPQI